MLSQPLPLLSPAANVAARVRVEQCPFRDQVREIKGTEIARCRLLQEISGVDQAQLCRVRRDACEACCQSSSPSHAEINPIIASLLYELADRIIKRGGVQGCHAGKATALQSWAQVNLEVEHPENDVSGKPYRADGRSRIEGGSSRSRSDDSAPDQHGSNTDLASVFHPYSSVAAIERLVPPPEKRRGPRIRRWAVGVTTAPRREPTLGLCLDSLARAGWDGAHLFVDSGVTVPERFSNLPITFRETKVGAWPNYYLALMELLMRDPEADAFMLVQDDAIFYDRQDLRAYLERILWPADPMGLVSLYCPKPYTRPKAGWHKRKGRWRWGALAFVFPRKLAKRFVCDPIVLEHRWSGPKQGLVIIDYVIGAWASRHKVTIHYPCPSLVQHIGNTSTLWPHERAADIRRADWFAGDAE
jgi:hypothetical protein